MGQFDLGDNDLILHNGSLATINSLLQSGYNAQNGYWNGEGIVSSAAAADPEGITALGAIQNLNGSGEAMYSAFDGRSVVSSDVLVKYTYYGDANLDGIVNGDDYSLIDYGYIAGLSGWANGDFTYQPAVNGSDYTLIDLAQEFQPATISAPTARPAEPAVPYAPSMTALAWNNQSLAEELFDAPSDGTGLG